MISIKNKILSSIPPDQFERIQPFIESFEFSRGRVLYELDESIEYIYFPESAMVSLVTQMLDGRIIEVGLVGNEGMTGLTALFGQKRSAERALVQIANGGVRAPLSVIAREFERGDRLQKIVLSYANAFMRQVGQTAACNASHSVEERLSRWLLMCQDRVESNTLNLTQEFLSEMLGTRRATVNVAAITLQAANYIRYSRGQITIMDRPGLEGFSCECYEALKRSIALTQPAATT